MIKTYSPKPSELSHDWLLVDAQNQILGRLCTQIATHLIGKHKPQYAAHLDCGDNVVVINAAQIKVSGNKLEDKLYQHHSGYPGGLTTVTLGERLQRHPNRVIEEAVRRMLPQNRLTAVRLRRLRVYPGPEHDHAGQAPKTLGGNRG